MLVPHHPREGQSPRRGVLHLPYERSGPRGLPAGPIAARKRRARASASSGPSSISRRTIALPTITPSANAQASAACSGVADPDPDQQRQVRMGPQRVDHLAGRHGQLPPRSGDAVGGHAVDEPARRAPDQRVPLRGRTRRRQEHEVDPAGRREVAEFGRLVDREVGHDRAGDAGGRRVVAERPEAVAEHRVHVGHDGDRDPQRRLLDRGQHVGRMRVVLERDPRRVLDHAPVHDRV